jgi:cytochrome c oxidase subunit 1
MMIIAASYYWYPLITGRWYDRRLARFQVGLLIVGSVVTFGILLTLGFQSLPRRYANYPAAFAPLQQVATVGGYLIGLSAILWLYNMIWSYWNGDRIRDADVWDLKESDQFTAEWGWLEDRLERKYDVQPTEPETVRASYTTDPEQGSPHVLTDPERLVRSVLGDTLYGALGGLIGTLAMSGVLFTGSFIGVFDVSAFAELGGLVGLGEDPLAGYLLFILGGVTTWAILFRAIAEFLPGRLLVVTGLSYATIMSTGFVVAFYTGQSGLELVGYLVFALVAHWLYGLGLAGTIRYAEYRRTVGE